MATPGNRVIRCGTARLRITDALNLRVQPGNRGQIEIAFQQGREHAKMPVCRIEQRPDRFYDVGAVRIDNEIIGFVVMSGDVRIGDPVRR